MCVREQVRLLSGFISYVRGDTRRKLTSGYSSSLLTRTPTDTFSRTQIHTHTHTHTHACMHTYVQTRTHTHTRTNTHLAEVKVTGSVGSFVEYRLNKFETNPAVGCSGKGVERLVEWLPRLNAVTKLDLVSKDCMPPDAVKKARCMCVCVFVFVCLCLCVCVRVRV